MAPGFKQQLPQVGAAAPHNTCSSNISGDGQVLLKSKVTVVGSGNWGSVAAKLIASNTLKLGSFHEEVRMWVFEETLPSGEKLTDVINRTNENVKYLPGIKLGKNVVADPDLENAVKDANMLVFATPHQFMEGICKTLVGKIKTDAEAISLVKGVEVKMEGPRMTSNLISEKLGINCSVLMGANIANEAAIMRIGLKEMRALSKLLFLSVKDSTFFESCGVADLITTCLGGRNRKVAEAFAKNGGQRSFDELEAEMLQGQKLQGVSTAREVYEVLSHRGLLELFPLFTTVHEICTGRLPPSAIVEYSGQKPKLSLLKASVNCH
ncbi:hypothetical protein SLEP1_g45217 [Rubroshorea leprosula]|uniref:glycerol-3-phosphate dehydrogenase (NAD(+)) n=1 Tax=Rubroshorea leprosula TaxID=152421 RepID=A0AAV5LII1_9ROSI|nr:hypothetical protein SLEP1_g45217 [Rubroshorea leprosula]